MTPRPNLQLRELLDQFYDGLDRRRIDEILPDIDRELAAIAGDWPGWARSILDLLEAAEADGNRFGSGRGGSVSDPTSGIVGRREPLTRDRSDVFGHLDDALYALKQARQTMGSVALTAGAAQLQSDLDAGRCTGGMGLPRSEVWGDTACRALAVRKGMCWKHYDAHRDDERAEAVRRLERYS